MTAKIATLLACSCLLSGAAHAVDYSLNASVTTGTASTPSTYNWNDAIWTGGATANDGPTVADRFVIGDNGTITGGNATRDGARVSIVETGGTIGGAAISALNNKRTLGGVLVGAGNPGRTIALTGGFAGLNSAETLQLEVGTLEIWRGVALFMNSSNQSSDTTKLALTVNSLVKRNASAGTVAQFGHATLGALESVTFQDAINFSSAVSSGDGSTTLNFDNISSSVTFANTVNMVIAGKRTNTNFTKVGTADQVGEIRFTAADDGVLFSALSLATITNADILGTKIIFDGLDLLAGDETILSWITLTGATGEQVLANIIASNAGHEFKLGDDGLSIVYNGASIPEPAEVAALLGLAALGFAAYRRRK